MSTGKVVDEEEEVEAIEVGISRVLHLGPIVLHTKTILRSSILVCRRLYVRRTLELENYYLLLLLILHSFHFWAQPRFQRASKMTTTVSRSIRFFPFFSRTEVIIYIL